MRAKGARGFILATGLLLARPVQAQNVGGSIQGTVSDGSGHAIAGAHVAVRNAGTGDVRELVTEPSGRYHAPLLPPGEYEVKVSMTGFQTVERRGVRLTVGAESSLKGHMNLHAWRQERNTFPPLSGWSNDGFTGADRPPLQVMVGLSRDRQVRFTD